MKLVNLRESVNAHSGEFLCQQMTQRDLTKTFPFSHQYESPQVYSHVPDIGKLKEFYETFGSLCLYYHQPSECSALYIGSPDEWEELADSFVGWVENLDEDEREELLPDWIDGCLVIGEIPRSGNYVLVPTQGEKAGYIFEFEHDGFEFIEEAKNIEDYIQAMLNPDGVRLVNIAGHMRFVEGDPMEQWWILDMKDNKGNFVTTRPEYY